MIDKLINILMESRKEEINRMIKNDKKYKYLFEKGMQQGRDSLSLEEMEYLQRTEEGKDE